MIEFENKYKVLQKCVIDIGEYSLVPIRYEDRFDIMRWRNEQIYHLRQSKPLTERDQERYFREVVAKLFSSEYPEQILFSYLERGKCIGYGGLVHINWESKNAEISFIMDTDVEKNFFYKHWEIFLNMLQDIAFNELTFHKIYTYAFDLRPHLYGVLEAAGFKREAVLEDHCYFDGKFKDVIIHAKFNNKISIRKATSLDVHITYEWANDKDTRLNSFSSQPISFENHQSWWQAKMKDSEALYLIGELDGSAACLIRFDKIADGASYIIGINLDPIYRGKRLSHQILQAACNEFFNVKSLPIEAYIKPDNMPSVKTFEKAGFRFVKQVEIAGSDALLYELKKI